MKRPRFFTGVAALATAVLVPFKAKANNEGWSWYFSTRTESRMSVFNAMTKTEEPNHTILLADQVENPWGANGKVVRITFIGDTDWKPGMDRDPHPNDFHDLRSPAKVVELIDWLAKAAKRTWPIE